jgi:hypothetical protein
VLCYENGQTCSEIADQLGFSVATVTKNLRDRGVEIEQRTRNPNAGRTPEQQAEINARISASRKGKGTGPRGAQTRVCEECGAEYPARSRGRQYCSAACRAVAVTRAQGQAYRDAYDASPVRCPCGTPIPYEVRHSVKYCSDACRAEYMVNGKQRDPDKWITFDCARCGEETTRRKSIGNMNRFCSVYCANRFTMKKIHYAVKDQDVLFDSSWEAAFYGICRIAKIPIGRFDREQGVAWRDGGVESWYAPDFWLPSIQPWTDRQGVAVEIKGLEDDHDEARWVAFRATGRDLVVMDSYRMEHLSAHDVADVLRIAALKDNPRS